MSTDVALVSGLKTRGKRQRARKPKLSVLPPKVKELEIPYVELVDEEKVKVVMLPAVPLVPTIPIVKVEPIPASVVSAPIGADEKVSVPRIQKNSERTEVSWDASSFPVLKKHSHRMFPQTSYHIPVSYSWNKEKIEAINAFSPASLDKLKVANSDNEHPFCAGMRAITEAYALQSIIAELSNTDCKDSRILDVGGAAKRHFSHKRKHVWSCIPPHDARDMIRRFDLPGKLNCNHFWNECNCNKFCASMSVHALYYIKPAEMIANMLKQTRPIHYAVVHRYPETKGTIMMGEMSYVKHEGFIWVTAAGNLTKYYHPDNEWMFTGHFHTDTHTLEWDIARRFGDTYVLRFVAYEGKHLGVPPLPDLTPKTPEVKTDILIEKSEIEIFEEIVKS